MSNEAIWIFTVLVDFLFIIISIKLFGKLGVYFTIISGIILCNIQVVKIVEIFGVTATLGNIAYGSIFLATDLLSECYGKQEAKRAVVLGFYTLVFFNVALNLSLWIKPAADDIYHHHMLILFNQTTRISIASFAAYLVSQFYDVWIFDILKNKMQGKHLWLRNNFSTISSQLLDTAVFSLLAFYKVFPLRLIITIATTTFGLKLIVALLDTPFAYLGRFLLKQHAANHANPSQKYSLADGI